MTRTSRLAARRAARTDRRRRIIGVLLAVAVLAVPASLATGAADEPAPDGHDHDVADYPSGTRWPGSRPEVCVEDASRGFPVAQAATEFEGTPVTFDVRGDCAGADNVVRVVTVNEPDEGWAGWFDADLDPEDDRLLAAGRIRINLAHAYRADPTFWRTLLVHELGHAAGLGHTHEGTSIMHPGERALLHAELTEQDRDQLDEIYGDGQ